MPTKYYQIRQANNGGVESVGVLKVVNNIIPIDPIQKAIRQHLDEEIKVLAAYFENVYNQDMQIKIEREDGEIDYFTAEETWLLNF